jgi:hypothetical protein
MLEVNNWSQEHKLLSIEPPAAALRDSPGSERW